MPDEKELFRMAKVDPESKASQIRQVLPRLQSLVSPCLACGRSCGADRAGTGVGSCRAGLGDGLHVRWQAAVPHFGEEPMLVGKGGSGTVFFSYCCLTCEFCQNWQISQGGEGENGHYKKLAEEFIRLQKKGVENINLVTPTQYIFPIVSALGCAYEQGLNIPVVYNTNGYDSVELVRILDGIVDVWLPDLKYMSSEPARCYSHAANYPEVARAALRAMYSQSGPLVVENGVAVRGVLARHLVLPDDLSGSFDFLLWLKDEGMTDIMLSLMSQYSPQYRASLHPEIDRPLSPKEYQDVVDFAERLSFEHVLVQEMDSRSVYLPDFRRQDPFLPPE